MTSLPGYFRKWWLMSVTMSTAELLPDFVGLPVSRRHCCDVCTLLNLEPFCLSLCLSVCMQLCYFILSVCTIVFNFVLSFCTNSFFLFLCYIYIIWQLYFNDMSCFYFVFLFRISYKLFSCDLLSVSFFKYVNRLCCFVTFLFAF